MALDEARDRILLATLPHVAFDGWVERALRRGTEDAGYPPDIAMRAFPGGALDVIRHWSSYSDRRMLEEIEKRDILTMRFRDRIAAAVRIRIELNAAYREAVRRTISFLALPQNTPSGAQMTYATVNAIWYAAGDTSTDFSFYTKRATLASIYVATTLYWLDDTSDGFEDTWAFLDRRIEDVMQIPKLRGRLRAGLTFPFSLKWLPHLSGKPRSRRKPA